MKVEAECLPCLLERGYRQVCYLTGEEKDKIKVLRKVLRMLAREYGPEAFPAKLGTQRDRIIRSFFGGKDPYAGKKEESNRLALRLLPKAEAFLAKAKNPYQRFRRACLTAAMANALEFDIKDYSFTLEAFRPAASSFTIDHTKETYQVLKKGKPGTVFYLADNAGEIVFDRLLTRLLREELGLKVVLVVKGKPVLNDATLRDVEASGIRETVDEVETIGDTVGFIWDEAPSTLRNRMLKARLVVAKGMGNYEALTELEGKGLNLKVLFLLKAKCGPVARSLKVEKGSLVALLKTL